MAELRELDFQGYGVILRIHVASQVGRRMGRRGQDMGEESKGHRRLMWGTGDRLGEEG